MKHDHVDFVQAQWAQEKPGFDTSPIGVIGRISRISRHLDQALQKNYSKFDLNGGEFDVLASLRRSGHPYQLTPTELFNSLMLSSGAMTNRLDRLEDAGLIKRNPNPTDRRGLLVTLTEQGIEVMDRAYPAHIANEDQILSSLTLNEREILTDLLRKMLLSFEENRK
ncbi:MAG: MarR family transcriptional regulator [Chloroflexi bacterium]|nr:MAG: MarR family transcriptional regulator [Chloroflexota bacterium]MBL1196416.1 MarR family transcriptional regulator [Chloroflexota bacterium]NOH13711.1 MarR family transcriptional regulator [Chloroflexota bacterium]